MTLVFKPKIMGLAMTLETLALIIMIMVAIILFYAIIAIHDIPYNIAKKRNHPHAEAIHYGGWVSMFTLHAIWPFLWIWATLYHADRGYGFSDGGANSLILMEKLGALEVRLDRLEQIETAEEAEG
jgi:Protein of unknown function (DUF3302)